MVIEWNAHIFSPDLARYPLHPQAVYHPEPYGDDHRLIRECLQREPERLLNWV